MSTTVATVARPTVLGDIVGGTRARDLLLVLAGAALTAICAQISIHIPGSPIPVTAQTFAVVVAGASLGSVRGGISQLLYVAAGLIVPVYAGGTHGWSVVAGANGGYLVGFVIAAYVVGLLAERGNDRQVLTALLAFAAGQLVIYGVGVPWLKAAAGMSWGTAIHEGFTIFIVGGVIKAVAAGLIAPGAWRLTRSS